MDKLEEPQEESPPIKVFLVGDHSTGKTLIAIKFTSGFVPDGYIPTSTNYVAHKEVFEGAEVSLGVLDAPRDGESAASLRALGYPGTDVLLICCSVVEPQSFKSIEKIWIPEMERYAPNTPFIIVGTKTDLRPDSDAISHPQQTQELMPRNSEEGKALAKRVGAVTYMETSVRRSEGIHELFQEAIRVGLQRRSAGTEPVKSGAKQDSKGKCIVM